MQTRDEQSVSVLKRPSNWIWMKFRLFWVGATLPWAALRLIFSKPNLIFWSSLPFGLACLLYYFVAPRLKAWTHEIIQQGVSSLGVHRLGTVGEWIMTLFSWFATGLFFFFAALIFSSVAAFLASPFHDFLAEATEVYCNPPLSKVPHPSWRDRCRMILIDAFKTGFGAISYFMLLVLSWIPIFNSVAMLLSFWIITFQFVSYPQTRRSQGVRAGIHFIANHLAICTGFGGVMTILLSIPLVSAFFLPVAVVGGTLLVSAVERPQNT